MRFLRFLAVLAIPGLAVSCARPLPEAFGVYARSDRTLISVARSDDLPSTTTVAADSSFIFFDNRLAPGQDLTSRVGFQEAYWTRYVVEQITDYEGGPIKRTETLPWEQFGGIYSGIIEAEVIPVEGKAGMLEVRPRQALPDGVYRAFLFKESYPFVVGKGGVDASKERNCFDSWQLLLNKDAKFSWENYFSSVGNLDKRQNKDGHVILKSEYKACSELDSKKTG